MAGVAWGVQRPAAGVEGNWKHDMYGKPGQREPRGDDRGARRAESGHKSAKLVVTNLHYDVSEQELDVSSVIQTGARGA